jgi:predicted 2-oxoglutarate/Fe(II)-dependent dioxygenase YbiX
MEKQVVVPDQVFTISNFMPPDECAQYINLSENNGYGDAPITTASGYVLRPEVRNNARVILDDPALAVSLWQRIAPFVPTPVEERTALGLNERIRFYRYDVRQTFAPHYDGSFRRPNGEQSQVTFMIYLNDDFVGGETKFDLRYPHGEVSVVPKAGMAILFLHHLRHEGAPVQRGRKYVLRTDVMYSAFPDE